MVAVKVDLHQSEIAGFNRPNPYYVRPSNKGHIQRALDPIRSPRRSGEVLRKLLPKSREVDTLARTQWQSDSLVDSAQVSYMPMCVALDVFSAQENQIPIELILHFRYCRITQEPTAELHESREHERAQIEAEELAKSSRLGVKRLAYASSTRRSGTT